MSPPSRLSKVFADTWVYALLGGFVSIVLAVGLYVLSNGTMISGAIFAGGAVAGFFAQRSGTTAGSVAVGIRAGLIGSIPGVVSVGMLIEPIGGPIWSRILGTAGVAVGYLGLIIGVSAVVGGLSGVAGWKLASSMSSQNAVSTT